MDDEALMRGRVYGADHDDPDPGPQPGHEYRELCAGPLDGLLLFSELQIRIVRLTVEPVLLRPELTPAS
ncbi:hypothetical protein OG535_40240 [Kitasatospora sp. NBC_00085]|uniref:hypothetical protein n=2 Tax=Kitasatospora TaxID=2063 RepID=UPI00324A7E03